MEDEPMAAPPAVETNENGESMVAGEIGGAHWVLTQMLIVVRSPGRRHRSAWRFHPA